MATRAASEGMFSMAGPILNNRRAHLQSSSVNDILIFNSAFKAKNKAFKVDQKVLHFNYTVFFKSFCWLWNEQLTMLH